MSIKYQDLNRNLDTRYLILDTQIKKDEYRKHEFNATSLASKK